MEAIAATKNLWNQTARAYEETYHEPFCPIAFRPDPYSTIRHCEAPIRKSKTPIEKKSPKRLTPIPVQVKVLTDDPPLKDPPPFVYPRGQKLQRAFALQNEMEADKTSRNNQHQRMANVKCLEKDSERRHSLHHLSVSKVNAFQEMTSVLHLCNVCSIKSFLCLSCKTLVGEFYQSFPTNELDSVFGRDLPPPDDTALDEFKFQIEKRKQETIGVWNQKRKALETTFNAQMKEFDDSVVQPCHELCNSVSCTKGL